MTAYELGFVAILAALGAGAAHAIWRAVSRRLAALADWRATRKAGGGAERPQVPRPAGAPAAEPPLQRPAPGAPPAAAPPPQPEPESQLAALREQLATLAQGQITLIESRAEQESRLLAELRAVVAVPNPEIQRLLEAIDAKLAALAGGPVAADDTEPPPTGAEDEGVPGFGAAGDEPAAAEGEPPGPQPFGPVPGEGLTAIPGGAVAAQQDTGDDSGERLLRILGGGRETQPDQQSDATSGNNVQRS